MNPVADGRFGSSVSISETIAVVGSKGPTASVFRFNGTFWEHEQELPTPKSLSISVDRDRILVGSYNRGLATVYRFNGTSWYEEQTLTKEGEEFSTFGRRVSLSGDTALVGAFDAVYVYRFNGNSWVEEQMLTPSNPAAGFFGVSVSESGDTALIGAVRVSCADGDLCGAAYVFRFITRPSATTSWTARTTS